jgi:hypothetical protein
MAWAASPPPDPGTALAADVGALPTIGTVTPPAVFDMADVALAALLRTRQVPASCSLKTRQGATLQLSPAQALWVMAKLFADRGPSGSLPAEILVPADVFGPPGAGPSNTRQPSRGQGARTLLSEQVVQQSRAVIGLTAQFGALPAGVWVGSERLSCAEFFQALASLLRTTKNFQIMPDVVSIVPCASPLKWQFAAKPAVTPTPTPAPRWEVQPMPAIPPSAPPDVGPSPRLDVLPAPGSTVSGQVSLVAVYRSPGAYVVFRIDDRDRAITNAAPYTYSWDTRGEKDGEHKLVVSAIAANGDPLARQEFTLTVNNTAPPAEAED